MSSLDLIFSITATTNRRFISFIRDNDDDDDGDDDDGDDDDDDEGAMFFQ